MTNISTVILFLEITQFHSVTKVDSNSNSANAKSAFLEHEPLTLKVEKMMMFDWLAGQKDLHVCY